MQYGVFANPLAGHRSVYRLIVVVQSDMSAGDRRIVAPLLPQRIAGPGTAYRTTPLVTLDGESYLVMLTLLGTVPTASLKAMLGSLEPWRDDITAGLDWVLPGA